MALQGNLRDFNLVQLLNLINLTRKTGRLSLDSSKQKAALYFNDGQLLHADIPGETVSLDALLLQAGKITPEQARELGQGEDTSDKALAMRLVDFGYLSQDAIMQQLRQRSIEAIYSLFTWQEGSFQFETNVAVPDEAIAVPARLEGVIIEGSRRVQEWERLNQQLPDLNVVVRMAATPGGSPNRQISLSMDEWQVIPMIAEGRHTLAQIARQHKLDGYKIRKLVYRLMSNGLVELGKGNDNRKLSPTRPAVVRESGFATIPRTPQPGERRNVVQRLFDRIKGS